MKRYLDLVAGCARRNRNEGAAGGNTSENGRGAGKYLGLVAASDETLAEHDERYHKPKFDPETMTCELRERRAKLDSMYDDLDENVGIKGIYTGSAASYNRPSLIHVGAGEGNQVYGWGLYGSTVRGVAEWYAAKEKEKHTYGYDKDSFVMCPSEFVRPDPVEVQYDGADEVPEGASRFLKKYYSPYEGNITNVQDVLYYIRQEVEEDGAENGYPEDFEHLIKMRMYEEERAAYEWIEAHKENITLKDVPAKAIVYEQAFFTNRAEGDESHLLSWYEPVSEENLKRVVKQMNKEMPLEDGECIVLKGNQIYIHRDPSKIDLHALNLPEYNPCSLTKDGEQLYTMLSKMPFLGSPKAASEFLVRADIDGIKYPADSYGGKTVKDGDKVGWNYVSFRDDNIRVNRKWVDGVESFAKDAWVDSGTGNMAWKGRKYKTPFDRLPKRRVREIIAENVSLIKTIDSDLLPDVASRVYRLVAGRLDPDDFIDWLMDECDVSEARAYLIATDQVNKAKERMKIEDWISRGIRFAIWRHNGKSKDPREYHIRKWDGKSGLSDGFPNGLNGFPFCLKDPPVIDPKTMERGYPSTLIGCKCYISGVKGA